MVAYKLLPDLWLLKLGVLNILVNFWPKITWKCIFSFQPKDFYHWGSTGKTVHCDDESINHGQQALVWVKWITRLHSGNISKYQRETHGWWLAKHTQEINGCWECAWRWRGAQLRRWRVEHRRKKKSLWIRFGTNLSYRSGLYLVLLFNRLKMFFTQCSQLSVKQRSFTLCEGEHP